MITDAALIFSGVVATLYAGWFVKTTQEYARRNPAQAILEGAELLEWQRMATQAKGGLPSVDDRALKDASIPKLTGGGERGR
jgi:uncharacterized SAM-binding protein YcdF (DUF218 family)